MKPKGKIILKTLSLLLIWGLLVSTVCCGQTPVTTDPILEGATVLNGQLENQAYDKIIDHQTNIQRFQELTLAAEDEINTTKKKIYDGLHYVSSTLENGYDVYICSEILDNIYINEKLMMQAAQKSPLALAWAVKLQKLIIDRAIGTFSQIQDVILKKDDKNYLMDAGERAYLLMQVRVQLQAIEGLAMQSNFAVQWVVNQGIMNALNPFAGMVNTDGQVVHQILHTWSY